MTWALKRQLFYVGIVLFFLAGVAYMIAYPYLNKTPTCNDGRQNGEETGVDCGGLCLRACLVEQDEIRVQWSRAFKVVAGRYNAVAYLEHKNQNVAIDKINYSFRFADKDNVYIGKREGTTFIPPAGKFVVFEPAINVGSVEPVYTTFEFTSIPKWEQQKEDKVDQLKVFAIDVRLENETTTPRLSAMVKNNSLFIIPDVEVVAILYDAMGNAVSVSKTELPELKGQESLPVVFTWPEPFTQSVVFKEIIPMYNIISAELK